MMALALVNDVPTAPALSMAQRVDAYGVDRSILHGSSGVDLARRLRPLEPQEQAFKDRCDEKVRRAKEDDTLTPYEVRRRVMTHGTSKGGE